MDEVRIVPWNPTNDPTPQPPPQFPRRYIYRVPTRNKTSATSAPPTPHRREADEHSDPPAGPTVR
ncbi:MAG TPA: hypothetical protein VNW54_06230 [Granulicella sp.]|nr:hypothetical protein [Granulicella sp.]